MKKTQFVELLANIRKTFVSFFSIVMFVALGASVYLGIRASAVRLENAAEQEFGTQSFHDIEITFPYGLSDDDLAAIEQLKGVDEVYPSYITYATNELGGVGHPLVIRAINEGVDVCRVIEGEMPTQPNQIAIGQRFAYDNDIKPGDTFELVKDAPDNASGSGMTYLTTSTFTVTALVANPNYVTQHPTTLGVSTSGEGLEAFAYVPEAAFDKEAFQNLHPSAYVRSNELRGLSTFSDEYKTRAAEIKSAIEETGKPRGEARYNAIIEKAQKQVDDAQKQIDEGEKMLDDANQQIADGEVAIADGAKQLESALAQLQSGEASLEQTRAQGEAMLSTMAASLNKFQEAYDAAKSALANNQARVDSLTSQVSLFTEEARKLTDHVEKTIEDVEKLMKDFEDGTIDENEYLDKLAKLVTAINLAITTFQQLAQQYLPDIVARYPEIFDFPMADMEDIAGWIEKARAKLTEYNGFITGAENMLAEAKAELEKLQAEVDSLQGQLNNGWAQYESARNNLYNQLAISEGQLAEGRQQYNDGQAQLEEKTQQLEDGKKEVAEKSVDLEKGKEQLADAKEQVSKLVSMGWIVNDRSLSSGVMSLQNIIDLTNNLRLVMASLFVVVGLLVCYSAISRIVHDQIRQIGTKKALGFTEGEVTASFMLYTALAVLVGVALGVAISALVVQGILFPSLQGSFYVSDPGPVVQPVEVLIFTGVELALLLACTWFACHGILKRQAIDLLAGEQKSMGRTRFYERWPIWQKLPLLTQTMINNCVNDKRRVFATLIGVAGCTALVVTASTMDNNIRKSFEDHYGIVADYDITVRFSPSTEGALEGIEKKLADNGLDSAPITQAAFLLEGDEVRAFEQVFVPADEESFAKFFHLNVVPMGGTAKSDGAWVSRAHAEHRGLKVGDKIVLCTVTGERYEVDIAGFYDYYLPYNTMVMSPAYYHEVVGSTAAPNAVLVNSKSLGADGVRSLIEGEPGFRSIYRDRDSAQTAVRMFTRITKTVVYIYVGLAALMAIVVLLNLDYMFIDEKKKELIVLMINGFSVGDAKAYIYRDAIIMTILGIGLGLVLGSVMGAETVRAIEWQSCSFIKSPDLMACLLGAGIAAFFAVVMMLISLRRIPRFSLTDIAKF